MSAFWPKADIGYYREKNGAENNRYDNKGVPPVAITITNMIAHKATKTASLSGLVMGHKSVITCRQADARSKFSMSVFGGGFNRSTQPSISFFLLGFDPKVLRTLSTIPKSPVSLP